MCTWGAKSAVPTVQFRSAELLRHAPALEQLVLARLNSVRKSAISSSSDEETIAPSLATEIGDLRARVEPCLPGFGEVALETLTLLRTRVPARREYSRSHE